MKCCITFKLHVLLKLTNRTFSLRCQHGVHNSPNKMTVTLPWDNVSLFFVENKCKTRKHPRRMHTSHSPTVRSQLPGALNREVLKWTSLNRYPVLASLVPLVWDGKARRLYREGWDQGLYKGKKTLYSEVQCIMGNGQIGPHLWTDRKHCNYYLTRISLPDGNKWIRF